MHRIEAPLMGRRGPQPLPTSIKLLRGERRPQRLNLDEPKVAPGLPERPSGMVTGADAVWDALMAALGPSGAITPADGMAVRGAAEAVAISRQLASVYQSTGARPIIRTRADEIVDNPILRELQRAQASARIALREIGATPTSRSSIRVARAPTADPLESLVARSDQAASD